MNKFQSLVTFVTLCLSTSRLAFAAIGPVTDLTISDADIAPDGFTRAAVVVNDQYPGPLITGNKVCVSQTMLLTLEADVLTMRRVITFKSMSSTI